LKQQLILDILVNYYKVQWVSKLLNVIIYYNIYIATDIDTIKSQLQPC